MASAFAGAGLQVCCERGFRRQRCELVRAGHSWSPPSDYNQSELDRRSGGSTTDILRVSIPAAMAGGGFLASLIRLIIILFE